MQVPSDPFLAFLDTRADRGLPDLLTNPQDLTHFGLADAGPPELAEARQLRDGLVEAILRSTSPAGRRARLNALFTAYQLLPQIGTDSTVRYLTRTPSLLHDLPGFLLGQALELERTGMLDKLKVCSAVDCIVPFFDTSTNQRRSYCSTTCATRMRVRKHRHS